ncbi:MAG: DUF1566 domain-containing protein [Treponema sp.]|jgi:TolB-like protein|nr:DUF1566 domain-containing protein [Treponema sp.]
MNKGGTLKKRLPVLWFGVCVLVFSCASTGGGGVSVPLDQAIQTAAGAIDGGLEKGVKIAALNFSSPSEQLSGYVLDELSGHLVNARNLVVVDRTELDLLRQEEQFQMSGEVSDESALSIGQKLGAQFIVSGGLSSMGNAYRFRIRVLNVETAAVEAFSASDLSAKEEKLVYLLAGARPAAETASVPQSPRSAPAKKYQIGDTGPAGGIVFFDKGVYESGWRYLEAAPQDFPAVQWGAYGTVVGGTDTGIGSGKGNTELIVQKLKKLGEQGRAAQLCAALDAGGYTDWFLPSRDELNLMYQNLKKKKLGGFLNGWYWSSSENSYYYAWYQSFSDGSQSNYDKDNPDSVRAVRAF